MCSDLGPAVIGTMATFIIAAGKKQLTGRLERPTAFGTIQAEQNG
jgi:hypothetical protein